MAVLMMAPALLFILLGTRIVSAADDDRERVFDIPRYEAEQVITDWLVKAGYSVTAENPPDKVVLKALKQNAPWEIRLRYHSPLATVVESGETLTGRSDALWRFLGDYQDGTYSARGFPPREVPAEVQRRRGSAVCIRAVVKDRPLQLSGFVVDTSGLILCTAHMLKNPTQITIVPPAGGSVGGAIVKIDYRKDLALIDCSRAFGGAVSLNNHKPAPGTGVKVFTIGCPRGHAGTVISGVVSGPPRLVEGQPLIQVRMEVEPGSSGSPVFDEQGDLVGVVQGRMKSDHRSGLLVPLQTVIDFVKER
jgi:serine protease Do